MYNTDVFITTLAASIIDDEMDVNFRKNYAEYTESTSQHPMAHEVNHRVLKVYNCLRNSKDKEVMLHVLIAALLASNDRKYLEVICMLCYSNLNIEAAMEALDDLDTDSQQYLTFSNHLKLIYDLRNFMKNASG